MHYIFFKLRHFLLSLLTGLLILSLLNCQLGQAVATEADVKNAVDAAIPLMPDLSITPQQVPIIDRDSKDKVLTYLVEAKLVSQYWFKITDYRLDWTGDLSAINLEQLALDIDRAYETRTPFSKAAERLTGSATVGVSAGPYGSGSVTISGPLDALLEVLGLVRGVAKLNVERVEIAIKGYADGQRTQDWKRAVSQLPEQYRRFPVLNPSDGQNDNWLFYRKPEREHTIVDPYSNDDLPDLRAQYIRKEFVEPFVQRFANKDRCHVYVLHNKPIGDPEKPEWRKAQVYLMVYLKQQP